MFLFYSLVWFANFLSAIGAMNWGLAIFFNYDPVARLCGMIQVRGLDRILYGTIGLAGVFSFISLFTGRI